MKVVFGNIGMGKQVHIFEMYGAQGSERPHQICGSGQSSFAHNFRNPNLDVDSNLTMSDVTCKKCLTKIAHAKDVENHVDAVMPKVTHSHSFKIGDRVHKYGVSGMVVGFDGADDVVVKHQIKGGKTRETYMSASSLKLSRH